MWRDKRDVRVISTTCDPVDGVVQRRQGCRCAGRMPTQHRPVQPVYGGSGTCGPTTVVLRGWPGVQEVLEVHFVAPCEHCHYQQLHHLHTVTHAPTHPLAAQHDTSQISPEDREAVGRRLYEPQACWPEGGRCPVIEAGNLAGHDLVKSVKKLVCRNCSQLGKATPQGRGVATTWKCRACDVPLCRSGCLVAYHTRHASR